MVIGNGGLGADQLRELCMISESKLVRGWVGMDNSWKNQLVIELDLNNQINMKYVCERARFYLLNTWHNLNGPAIIFKNGQKYWYCSGKANRLDGPAIIYNSGFREWMINGESVKIIKYE